MQLGASERDPAVALALTFAQQRSGRAQVAGRLVQALGDKRLGPQAQDYLIELGPADGRRPGRRAARGSA